MPRCVETSESMYRADQQDLQCFQQQVHVCVHATRGEGMEYG